MPFGESLELEELIGPGRYTRNLQSWLTSTINMENILAKISLSGFKNGSQNLELANSIEDATIDSAIHTRSWFRPEEKPKNFC